MKHQGPFFSSRHCRLHPRFSPFWKVILFLSSSTLTSTLSPQLGSIFAPIVAQAAFQSKPSKFDFGRRKKFSMTLIPVTPMSGAISSSSTSNAGDNSMSNGTCLRRSSRINNQGCDSTIQRMGVRLFQTESADFKGERGSSDKRPISATSDNVDVPVQAPKKRRVTRSSRKSTDESDGMDQTTSKPVRGSKAIPVTPEPVLAENDDASTDSPGKKSKPKAKSPKAKSKPKTKTKTVKRKSTPQKKASKRVVSWPEPDGWFDTYMLVRELRKDKTAPCDFMGAEALSIPPKNNNSNGDASMGDEEYAKISRFHTLIALMLSSQTKDAMVGQAMENLRDTSDGSGGLTVASILEMDPKVLNKKIYSVGFRNNKTKYIKQAAQILHDDYNGDVPPTAAEMIRDLPGVGPKMAYIVENICWDKQSGIGVDTHMQRLFPKLAWVSPDTKNPEQTRKQLESWLPQEYWGEVNLLWVGFGQEVQQERQKMLRKALVCSRPLEALTLLKNVDFDLYSEWNKMQSVNEVDRKEEILWTNNDEREKFNSMIEEALSKK